MTRSLYLVEGELEQVNLKLQEKYKRISEREKRWEEYGTEDVEWLMIAYGTCARIAKGALQCLSERGLRAGLLRPVTLWPFPSERLQTLAGHAKAILVVEMSSGQMVEDVRLAVGNGMPVHFLGRMGGGVPEVPDLVDKMEEIAAAAPAGDWRE